jgi:acyl-CoA synthetase (AMP-forming)/AMP-acid ligase II
VVDENGRRVRDGEVGEHIVTSYIQHGQPLIKYRTHDLVRWTGAPCACGTTWLGYPGGVLGRSDHMIVVKGVNVYPTAVEALLHKVGGLSEHYELHVAREAANDAVTVKAEARSDVPESSHAGLGDQAEAVLQALSRAPALPRRPRSSRILAGPGAGPAARQVVHVDKRARRHPGGGLADHLAVLPHGLARGQLPYRELVTEGDLVAHPALARPAPDLDPRGGSGRDHPQRRRHVIARVHEDGVPAGLRSHVRGMAEGA